MLRQGAHACNLILLQSAGYWPRGQGEGRDKSTSIAARPAAALAKRLPAEGAGTQAATPLKFVKEGQGGYLAKLATAGLVRSTESEIHSSGPNTPEDHLTPRIVRAFFESHGVAWSFAWKPTPTYWVQNLLTPRLFHARLEVSVTEELGVLLCKS